MLAIRHCNPIRLLRKAQWNRLVREAPASLVTTSTWHGTLTFKASDTVVGKHLFVNRAYERPWIERAPLWLRQLGLQSPERDVMVDAGAHIGMVACAMVKHGYFRRAIAVEPEPENFYLLHTNVQQNDLASAIQIRRTALSNRTGSMRFARCPGNSSGCHAIANGEGNPREGEAGYPLGAEPFPTTVNFPVTTLDRLLQEDFPSMSARIGLVWMDVEGHESQLLRGAQIIRDRAIPVVAELNPRATESAGVSKATLLDVWREYFGHFCVLDRRTCRLQPIAQIERVYDAQQASSNSAANLLLF
jgi:FkbM family methyltransferase